MSRIINWIAFDGIFHILFSLIITILFVPLLPIWGAALSTLGIGVLKELYDFAFKGMKFRIHDIVCYVVGISIGSALMFYLYFVTL